MLVGSILWALVIGQATSIIQQMDANKSAFREKLEQVKEYMQFRKIPLKTRREIIEYYEVRFKGKMFDEEKILSKLNPIIRTELINHNCLPLVQKVKLWKNCSYSFHSDIIRNLAYEVYADGDRICKEGLQGRRMYFIFGGEVKVISEKYKVTEIVRTGGHFGEAALIHPYIYRSASVYATETCYIYRALFIFSVFW